MEFTKNIQDIKWVAVNVIVTAIEGFLAAWAATGNKTDKASLGAAIGAAASTVWNLVIKPFAKQKGWL